MILDNENENLQVHEWISSYTEQGKMDIVTGYFTIGALAWLSKELNDKTSKFRLVLGDIVNIDSQDNRPLDLLNENITIEASLKLSRLSQEAVRFLKQDKVIAKTLEPNFCHAKSYLFDPEKRDDRNRYFISGSSNLTEAGIGLKKTNNMVAWFETLWKGRRRIKKLWLGSQAVEEQVQEDGSIKKPWETKPKTFCPNCVKGKKIPSPV